MFSPTLAGRQMGCSAGRDQAGRKDHSAPWTTHLGARDYERSRVAMLGLKGLVPSDIVRGPEGTNQLSPSSLARSLIDILPQHSGPVLSGESRCLTLRKDNESRLEADGRLCRSKELPSCEAIARVCRSLQGAVLKG